MQTYPRPAQERVHVDKRHVAGSCPECGADELKSYPVLSEGGWWNVTKCQACLHSVDRQPGGRLGSIELLSDQV